MENVRYMVLLSGFLFVLLASVHAMHVDRSVQTCCICSETASQLMHPYACSTSKDFTDGHGVCEECWQVCTFEHKYGGQLPLVCPQCRAQVKVDYKLSYVDGCLPTRPVRNINELVVFNEDTVLDGNVLDYDICFDKHGALSVKDGCTLFLKNMRLKNVRRGCIDSSDRESRVMLLLQNIEITRTEDYFFPDACVYPGFLQVNDVPIIWFKAPREFTDRHLRNLICRLLPVDAAEEPNLLA